MILTGRRILYSDETEITRDNLLTVLNNALSVHNMNRMEIQYLYDMYRGVFPQVIERKKEVREDIQNTVIENHAYEIVSFKTGYLLGEPIQYARRNEDEAFNDKISTLNGYMNLLGKNNKDKELGEWAYICGVSYRMVLARNPLEFDNLDPRNAFVVYNNGFGRKPLMGVSYNPKTGVFEVFTKNHYYKVLGADILEERVYSYPQIPIIEYHMNRARLGAFEPVITLLDAINALQSNRADAVEQFVQAFMKFRGVNAEDIDMEKINELKAIVLPGVGNGAQPDVELISSELNQSQVQILIDDLNFKIRNICGLPLTNGTAGSSSDTGAAVIYRDGWEQTEARARDDEMSFIESEKMFLGIVLDILNTQENLGLDLNSIDIKFNRRYSDNLLVKSQALTELLNDGIHPLIAYQTVGLFKDSIDVYEMSKKYQEEKRNARDEEISTDRSAMQTM